MAGHSPVRHPGYRQTASGTLGAGTPADLRDNDVAVPVYRILLVEDDAVDVRLIWACMAAIQPLRLTCEVVASVAAAKERLSEDSFDLCVTDFWLGFESSLRFVADVTRPEIGMPVIVLTSLSTPEIRRLCLQAGANSVVGKEHLSPGVIEAAIDEALRASRAAEDGSGQQDGVREGGSFLEAFERVMRRLDEPRRLEADRPPSERGIGPAADPAGTFTALSETARLGVLEQVVAMHGPRPHDVSVEPRDRRADLVEAVRKGCSLIEAQGRSVAFRGPARAVEVACTESAMIFLALELMNRVGALTGNRDTLTVDLGPEEDGSTLRVSAPVYGGMPALPVTFGSLFTSILTCCHGTVEMVHDGGLSIMLVARFANAPGMLTKPRSH